MTDSELDCTALRCPMPIVRIGIAVRNLAAGQRITVKASDPAFEADLAAWSRQTGHRVIHFERAAVQTAVIEKV